MRINGLFKSIPVILLLAVVFGCAHDDKPKKIKREDRVKMYYDTGIGYLNKGKPRKALDVLKQAEDLDPDQPNVLHAIGLAYFAMNLYSDAERYLVRAEQAFPGDPELHNNLAGLYLAMGRYDDTIREAELALNNPDYRTPAAAYFNRGMAYYRQGDLDRAEADFIEAIRREPMFDRPHLMLGRVLIDKGRFEDAIKALNAAVKLNEKNAEAYLYRGTAKWNRGYVTQAEDDFAAVLRLVPDTSPLAVRAKKWLEKIK